MLDQKLVRDLGKLRGQVITISLVVACGIATLVVFLTLVRSLEAARDSYYAQTRFADLFAHLDRAPLSLLSRLEEIPGVAQVEGRVVGDFRLELPGVAEPLLGRFVSLQGLVGTRLNELLLREGRPPAPGSSREVAVSEAFAVARGLHVGDVLTAVLGGHEIPLRVVGIALSPEFVYIANPRTHIPDEQHVGVLWMERQALADGMGLPGSFNDVVLGLRANANPEDVLPAVDRLLEPYGGLGAVGRDRQASNNFLTLKLEQWKSMARLLPVLFLAVAAFLLNLVLSRIIGTQREQIATLKALGFSSGVLVRHYLLLALVVCLLGGALGVGLGAVASGYMLQVLIRFFSLPIATFRFDAAAAGAGLAASLLAGAAGAFFAVRRVVALPAAEAMQPEPPESFKPTLVERLRLDRLVGVAGRMVLRDIERHPLRLLLSALSVAFATSILLVGSTLSDSLDRALEVQFTKVQAEDVTLGFDHPTSASVLHALQDVPGVDYAEPLRLVPVRLRAGWHEREVTLVGVAPEAVLRRPRDIQGKPLRLPAGGLALSRPLRDILGVGVGVEVEVEVLEAGRRRFRLPVTAFVEDFAGLSAYLDLSELDRQLGAAPAASGAVLAVERQRLPDISRRLGRIPGVASISRPDADQAQFLVEEADALQALQLLLMVFAAIIATGMVFNNARIALATRSRDLATLRILGFTRGEMAVVLVGEQAVQLVLGILFGVPLGFLFGMATMRSIPAEFFRLPAVLSFRAGVEAAAIVLVAGTLSAWVVRRAADRLDLVSVLKARD
ncbi:MAG: ABC transporter permease [Myxococcaceae bacterium]